MTFPGQSSQHKTFPHGIHPPECKEFTASKTVRRLPFPPEISVPLSQHTGAPAKAIVRPGQDVVRGEPIAEPGGFVSVPMHAPVTGVVKRIGHERDVRGNVVEAIFIEPYPAASQEVLYGSPQDIDSLTPKEIISAVQATGIVGLGGAAFPTHVKMAIPEGKKVDTIIVNGCECEPYLTTDYRVMLEQPDAIMEGIRIALKAVGAREAIIGVEDNKMDAVEVLRKHIPDRLPVGDEPYVTKYPQGAEKMQGKALLKAVGAREAIIGVEDNKMDAVEVLRKHVPDRLPVRVEPCVTKYPQGAEKMLVKALLNREIPSGGLPVDCGVAVFNVGTLAMLGNLLPAGQGLIERVVTVTGPGVKKPMNLLIPLGTPLRYVLDYCGYRGDDVTSVILGGPMMGMTVATVDIPVTKGVTGVLVLTRDMSMDESTRKIYPCIKCGSCIQACPMHLNPSLLGLMARKGRYEEMAETCHLMDCFECGSCSYVCPSNIPLVQYFRVAKSIVRQRQRNKKN